MAKNQNTFEKRRREMEKKWKAQRKRERKRERKEASADEGDVPSTFAADSDDDPSGD